MSVHSADVARSWLEQAAALGSPAAAAVVLVRRARASPSPSPPPPHSDPLAAAGGAVTCHVKLKTFIDQKILPGTGVSSSEFWSSLSSIVKEMAPRNHALLEHRNVLQAKVDSWHANPQDELYATMLRRIGYIEAEPEPFEISTQNIDPEISKTPGPQARTATAAAK